MGDPLRGINVRATSQAEPVFGRTDMVQNSAGGFGFALDDWGRLRRFLIIGTDGGTYYASEKAITRDNAECLLRCVNADGLRVVRELTEISIAGRAPKQNPALFALAACATAANPATRRAAEAALPKVCRIGTHLFQFAGYADKAFGCGWGKGIRKAVGNWYLDRPVDALAYQAVKYQQREGWSHRDLLRLSHPSTKDEARNSLLRRIVGKDGSHPLFSAMDAVQAETDPKRIAEMVIEHNLPWEALPSECLKSPVVWEALLPKLGLTALLRNLGRMTSIGLLKPLSSAATTVSAKLCDEAGLKAARVHPINILTAMKVYASGHGQLGGLTWTPVASVIDALNDAFYLAFGAVEPAGKRTVLALDVSGSMGGCFGCNLSPREISTAMAMVSLRTEPSACVISFQSRIVPINISKTTRLDDVVRSVSGLPFGSTDCSQPMLWALANKIEADAFAVYTDNETWAGRIHPFQALKQYRQETGIPARLVVVGVTATEFTIADPSDAGMMDVVGFDSAAPQFIADFCGGRA